jgi:CheY-like chemotaxis protein
MKPGDERLDDIKEIVKAADRAAGLVRKLLAFSRKQVLEPKVLNLNSIVSEMGRMLERVLGDNTRLTLALGQGIGNVKVDPGQIEQVLLNLTLNARDAMPSGGEITVTTADRQVEELLPVTGGALPPGRYITLSIKDTGHGMGEAVLSRIFEPFFTTKEPGKGVGLGLSTVYGIVKQSGGDIAVRSRPGAGTLFTIFLPAAAGPAETAPRARAAAAAETGKGLVLLVEDDDSMRQVARRILTAAGYSVIEAVNGRDALKKLAEGREPVSLLLTDIVMPEMSGVELALAVYAKYPGIKILCMSGYAGKEEELDEVLGSKAGYITKPFSPDVLIEKINALSGGKDPGGAGA